LKGRENWLKLVLSAIPREIPMFRRCVLALPILVLSAAALAQSPYVDRASQPIKALSDQQIADLRAGRGMGLALAAELNGYPGPSHVLEHADALLLSPEQRARTTSLFEAMKAEAVPLGERLIAQEAALEGLFAGRTVTPASLEAATGAIGATQAALRAAHLRYHLAMMEVLTPEQVRRYGELRGYAAGGHQGHGGHR
jgi:Spy/CpxP family protein refolding chaperone